MKLNKNRLLTLDKFIDQALYDKKFGYYMKKNPFGEKGDFITAPNISILYSEMIAIWIIAFWENLKSPKKFNLVELGSGNGEMMTTLISTFDRFPKFKSACRINILEKSPILKKKQKKKISNKNVKWLSNLDQLNKLPVIFIANEFFDALPIKQLIKKEGKWHERFVYTRDINNLKFKDILFKMKKFEKKIKLNISNNQTFLEYSPLMFKYLKIITKKIKFNNGGILIIDYGYLEKKGKNTLKAISKHKFTNILKNIGEADITFDLSFYFLKKIVKKFGLFNISITNQRNFLINMGILKRAELLAKKLPFSKKADIFYRIKKLIDKKEMGEIFKVMLITSKKNKFKLGF
jgi:cyclopropane-fatty-acyl-phospholipid synthase